MGKKVSSGKAIMKFLLILLLSVSVPPSSSFFFTSRSLSTCRSHKDCPGTRCVPRKNNICDLANIFRRNKENCSWYECADCLNDRDCSGRSTCNSSFRCESPYQRTTTRSPFTSGIPGAIDLGGGISFVPPGRGIHTGGAVDLGGGLYAGV